MFSNIERIPRNFFIFITQTIFFIKSKNNKKESSIYLVQHNSYERVQGSKIMIKGTVPTISSDLNLKRFYIVKWWVIIISKRQELINTTNTFYFNFNYFFILTFKTFAPPTLMFIV